MLKFPSPTHITLDLAAGNFLPISKDEREIFAGASRQAMVLDQEDYFVIYDPNADKGLCLQIMTADADAFYFDVNSQKWERF